jgi:hypothetical protein
MSYIIAVNVGGFDEVTHPSCPDKLIPSRHSSLPNPGMTAHARGHGTPKAPVQTWLLGWNAMMVCGMVLESLGTSSADGKLDVKHDLIIATSAVAGFSSILFGLCTNLPVGLG